MTHDHHAHLRQLSTDPTHTEAIREEFLKDVRQRFRAVRGDVRRVAGYEEDRFNLKQDAELADRGDIERFPTDAGKARAFTEWLAERLRDGVLEPVSRKAVRNGEHWTATYIRAAAGRAWENATSRLQQRGVDVSDADLEDVFRVGVPRQQLERLYTRAYDNLESITDEGVEPVRETLTQGLAEGWNPKKMARKLTDEVEALQKTRAEVLARTETIHSYTEMTISRYEQAGQTDVTVSGELATADDDRVCPICEAAAGTVYSTDTIRDATFEFEPSDSEPDHLAGEYPAAPPLHPGCRCCLLPKIS